jgi:hypothetical protein
MLNFGILEIRRHRLKLMGRHTRTLVPQKVMPGSHWRVSNVHPSVHHMVSSLEIQLLMRTHRCPHVSHSRRLRIVKLRSKGILTSQVLTV